MTRREALLALGITAFGGAATRPGAWPIRVASMRAQGMRTSFAPDVDITLTAAPAQAQILPGQRTKVWSFAGRLNKGPSSALGSSPGSYLGPTITVRRGQKVRIRFANRLPDPSIVHWHGLDVPQEADGHPRLAVPGGSDYVYEFEVTNRAGTYWYHPHPHMQTGPQVYRGLAGLFVVNDDEEAVEGGVSDVTDLACVLQDRRFDAANQLVYSTAMMDMETGMLGDRVLVNGQVRPEWKLGTRPYRLRVLNGSNARIYKLGWSDGAPMTVLATDGGLLERPLVQKSITLAPAQRIDLWLDLSGRAIGTKLDLRTEAFELGDGGVAMGGMMGAMGGTTPLPLGAPASLLSIAVARKESSSARLPDRLSTFDRSWQPVTSAAVRQIPITFQMMEWKLGGRTFEMDDVSPEDIVKAGSTHLWDFVNAGGPMGTQMAHPIHLHGRQFRVISRHGGRAANTLRNGLVDSGWMDTVLVLPGETVRVQLTFGRHPGLFLYHCHVLEHEDMGMMRNFRVVG